MAETAQKEMEYSFREAARIYSEAKIKSYMKIQYMHKC